jgi:hypothetical protein
VPAAGKSSRYGLVRPKYLLQHPKGYSMLTASLMGLKNLSSSSVDEVIVVVLEEHTEDIDLNYLCAEITSLVGLSTKFIKLPDHTSSMVDTITHAIRSFDKDYPIIVKDCDNQIFIDIGSLDSIENGICYADLHKFSNISPQNKSFIKFGLHNTINLILEKSIISSFINTGCVKFSQSSNFISAILKIDNIGEKFVSDIVRVLIDNGHKFNALEVDGYSDWGTLDDWLRYKNKFRTFFIDLDGTLILNANPIDKINNWKSFNPIYENINALLNLQRFGNSEFVFTTARHEMHYEHLISQLNKLGFTDFKLICGLQHSPRVLINDFAETNPYPTAISINIPRNSEFLGRYLNS